MKLKQSYWIKTLKGFETALLIIRQVFILAMKKLILYFFVTKFNIKKIRKLNIKCGGIKIKQHSKVKYLGRMQDETMSGETMVLSIINKINNKLKFIYRKNRFSTPTPRQFLCNALIQSHFDCACSPWYHNLTK